MENTFTFIITRDGEERRRLENQKNDFKVLQYFTLAQGYSMNHALKTGWKVLEINEQTKEESYWKPYY